MLQNYRTAPTKPHKTIKMLQNTWKDTKHINNNIQEFGLIAIPVSQNFRIVFFYIVGNVSRFIASLELIRVIFLVQFYSFAIMLLQLLILEGKTRFSLLLRRWLDGADWLDLMTPWPWLQELIKSMLEVSI